MGSDETILITGGAGFIGSHLADALLARGDSVVCLDNFSDYYDPARKRANIAGQVKHPKYRLIEGDIRDRDQVMQIFKQHPIDRVAHMAAMPGVRASIEQAALYVEVNLQGSIHLLDAARVNRVSNFIQASTSSIYGETDQSPFQEDQPTDRPLAPYPATKKAVEMMGYAYHNLFGLNFTALRFFNAYGPRVRPDLMAYNVLDSIVNDRELTLFSPTRMQRDWTFIEDTIRGVMAALDKPLGYEIINIGRGQPTGLQTFVNIAQELTGRQARIKIAPAPRSDPFVTFASVEKARRLLGYEPAISIQNGLARTWEWYRDAHIHEPQTGS